MFDRLDDQIEKADRDLRVLSTVIDRGPVGIVKLSEELDLPKHKVRYSLRMLENDELIDPTPQGAVPADGVAAELRDINGGIDALIDRLETVELL